MALRQGNEKCVHNVAFSFFRGTLSHKLALRVDLCRQGSDLCGLQSQVPYRSCVRPHSYQTCLLGSLSLAYLSI